MSNYDFCNILNCSEATIRNDLRELDEARLILRTRGGATLIHDSNEMLEEPLENFQIRSRLSSNTDAKTAIAKYLANNGIIHNNSSVVIDIGSTCYTAAKELTSSDMHLNIAAYSLQIAVLTAANPNMQLTLAGGHYSATSDSFFDVAKTQSLFSNMYFDYFIMGCNGVSKSSGVTLTMQVAEAHYPIKQLLVEHSNKTILLCDHTKINKTYIHSVCPIDKIDLIITDDGCNAEEKQSFLNLGIDVVFAQLG